MTVTAITAEATSATSTPTKGMRLDVLRGTIDCTNGGITATADELTLVGSIGLDRSVAPLHPGSRIFASTVDAPPVLMQVREVGGKVLNLVPAEWDENAGRWRAQPGHWMAGGHYADSCDSRVSDLARRLLGTGFYGAFAVHDRQD